MATLGFSFSRRQCEFLGLDWKITLQKLSKLNFKRVRLSVYWNEVERTESNFEFSSIKEEIKECKKNGFEIVVTVGMKAQRWPEFYIPEYIESHLPQKVSDVSSIEQVSEKTLEFIATTVKELTHYPITTWQIENEPLDKSGPKNWFIDLDFLQREIDLVKSIDNTRAILVTIWGNDMHKRRTLSKFMNLKQIDEIGFDFYPKQPFIFGFKGPDANLNKIKQIVKELKKIGIKPIISELQAEPWEAKFDYRKYPERIKNISIEQIKKSLQDYSKVGFEEIYLWGAEYWIWAGIENEINEIIEDL